MKSVALHNLGCKVNSYEIDVMQQMLRESGYKIVPFDDGGRLYYKYLYGDQYCGQEEQADDPPCAKVQSRCSGGGGGMLCADRRRGDRAGGRSGHCCRE